MVQLGLTRSSTLLHHSEYVQLSRCWFAFWWLVIFGVHAITCAYNAIYAHFYWNFNATLLSYLLQFNEIGMPREHFQTIGVIFAVLAAIHGACTLVMITASIRHRMLSFSMRKILLSTKQKTSTFHDQEKSTCTARLTQTIHYILKFYQILAGRQGLLGVDGRYFHVVLICRELLEMALQTVQAIRMSKFLAHTLLNRFFVCLLAINCWSSVLIYSRWFRQNEARRRFAAIVCDCILNLTTTVGVSTILVLDYLNRFNVDGNGFNYDVLTDDEWQAEFYNESNMIVVVSWFDLTSRVVFSFGLVIGVADLKEFLRCIHINRVADRSSPTSDLIEDVAPVMPLSLKNTYRINESSITTAKSTQHVHIIHYIKTGITTKRSHAIKQAMHVLFAVWGLIIVVLHVHATLQSPLFECAPKVHPMAGALPSCFVVNFDCHRLGISGNSDEVQKEWDKFDRKTTTKVRILHCSNLEVPTSFQDFHRLRAVEVYNSTIVRWEHEAAITNALHPKVTTLSIVRVNLTNGELPAGLQSFDFPLMVGNLAFCETNLQTLPSDLDLKWPMESGIYMENSQLTVVPPALIRLNPCYLFLSGNPITELPSELFESSIPSLTLRYLPLHQLPEHVTPTLTEMYYLDVTNTEISFFWSWIDQFIEGHVIYAGGSKYCSDLENILSGTTPTFSTSFSHGYSSVLMNASLENWDILRKAVDCTAALHKTSFDLDSWDNLYSLDSDLS